MALLCHVYTKSSVKTSLHRWRPISSAAVFAFFAEIYIKEELEVLFVNGALCEFWCCFLQNWTFLKTRERERKHPGRDSTTHVGSQVNGLSKEWGQKRIEVSWTTDCGQCVHTCPLVTGSSRIHVSTRSEQGQTRRLQILEEPRIFRALSQFSRKR